MTFYYQDGYLFCDDLSVKEIQKRVEQSPFYLYSSDRIQSNYSAYKTALTGIPSIISYAVKANGNLTILKILRDMGSWVTLVSGNEIRLALAAGFEPDHMIFNGNGKTLAELQFAANTGTFINIDSIFDIEHIHRVTKENGKGVSVFIRVNPEVDPQVHPYITTGKPTSKFGISIREVPEVLGILSRLPFLTLVGVHCHLGSTIDDVEIFVKTAAIMKNEFEMMRSVGFPVQFLNLGGGLGIDYNHHQDQYPTPTDLVESIKNLLPEDSILILEPGRSIVGNAGVLVCKVIGVKTNEQKNFIVTDGSMTELIRPSLYQAYHKIEFIEPVSGKTGVFDIVGPVCESTDFLGNNRILATPPEGAGVVVFDTGAYGYVMSSNYNARTRPPEYLVTGDQLFHIRRAENFDDQLHSFLKTEVSP